MLYIILIIIAIFLYLIYRKQNPSASQKIKAVANLHAEIAKREELLSNKIKTSHLKDYLQTEATLFEYGKKNYVRLSERYKHDDTKNLHVIKDWIYYMEALSDIIYESEMLDVASSNEDADEHRNSQQELFIKVQEIGKRNKELLGNEYVDPNKVLFPNDTSQ
jgi:hypothetical protein